MANRQDLKPTRHPAIAALLAALAGYVVLQALVLTGLVNPYVADIICYAGVVTVSALGLNLIYGYTGQFSLGHAAFYGVGAYSAALVTRYLGNGGVWTLPIGIGTAVLMAGLIGFLIGLPILRLRSDYLGIATLGFGIVMNVLFKNSDKLLPVLGGSTGMRQVPKLTTLPWAFGLTLLAIVFLRNLIYSAVGRALMSIREDELAAEAVGVNTTWYKTIGFVVGCMYAGAAGALYAHLYCNVHPDNFDFLKSIDVLLIVVLGGLGSISGTIVASLAWVLVLEGLRIVLPSQFQDWRMVFYPLLLIVFMLVRPSGMFGRSESGFLETREYRQQ